jgi:hypothetical protein
MQIVHTMKTATDLTASIGKLVTQSAQDTCAVAGTAGVKVFGVLTGTDGSTAASVCVFGVARVLAGATIALDAELTTTNAGAAVTAATGQYVWGRAMQAAVSGDYFTAIVGYTRLVP